MKPIKILITGAGAPGIQGTIFSVLNNYDNRKIQIIGTDAQEEVVGKYLCDKFYKIPKAIFLDDYLSSLIEICTKEKVDVILPQNTFELSGLSKNLKLFDELGTKVVVSDASAIENSNDKYKLMGTCKKIGIPVGKFKLVNNETDLKIAAREIGWPEVRIVVKPPISNGMRGVRIIDENYNPKKSFYEEKPSSLIINMENLSNILGESFPEIIVTEYLSGDEYTVDVLRTKMNIIVVPRKRELIRTGITFNSTVEKREDIIDYSTNLSMELNLKYCYGFQFKLDDNACPKILESNPRIQGTMVMSTISGANIIYSSVKEVLGETIPEMKINWDARLLRYWGGIGIVGQNIIKL